MSDTTIDSYSRWRFRKQLEQLRKKQSDDMSTCLVSLYVPPGKHIADIVRDLITEAGTAENIKSKKTRKNVVQALNILIARLRNMTGAKSPEKGFAIFTGVTDGGKMEYHFMGDLTYPINRKLYVCDSRFRVEYLEDQLIEQDTFGLLVFDAGQATIATLSGLHLQINKRMESGVPSKIRAGGQSAARFQRIREEKVHTFLRRIGDHSQEIYIVMRADQDKPPLKGLIVGGPGHTKDRFVSGDYLDYRLKERLLDVVDTGYSDAQGVKELIEKSRTLLKDLRYMQEKRMMQRFLENLGKDTGLVAYGESNIRRLLELGAVETLLLSTELNTVNISLICPNCGYSEVKTKSSADINQLEVEMKEQSCPKCESSNFRLDQDNIISVVEELAELAKTTGAHIELLSTETEEGEQLWRVFRGIAALLRFKQS